MTLTFVLLRAGADFTYIWSPDTALVTPRAQMPAISCWATITLAPEQQAELQAAIDSSIHARLQLHIPGGNRESAPLATASPNPADDPDQALRRLGRILFSQLLPVPLQELIRHLPAATPVCIVTNETELPWELLHDDQGFLALRHAVARQMLVANPGQTAAIAQPQGKRCLLIGNPNGNLPAADLEIEKLLDLLDTAPLPLRVEFLCREQATKLRVLSALASGEYQIIHFACHARPGALSLADGWLHADEIRTILRGNPLVFLNACSSARTNSLQAESLHMAGEQLHSLPQAFLAGGAVAFLGTLWPGDDDEMHQLALDFYRALCQRQTSGAALQQTRHRSYMRAARAATWAAPVFYGDLNYRLPAPSLHSQLGTVLTMHLRKTASLPQATDSAAGLWEPLQDFLTAAGTRVATHGGVLVSRHPGQLCAVFGAPGALEDDARRAIQAALEIGQLAEAHQQSAVIAVASGEITLDTTTTPALVTASESTFPLYLGTVFHEAEELVAQARPGLILVNAPARRLSEGQFAFAPYEAALNSDAGDAPPHPGGNGAHYEAYEVEALVPLPAAGGEITITPMRHPGQLLGRTRELAFLQSSWQDAAAGRGCVVGIVGEAGVGKTRLLQEFQRSLSRPDASPREYIWVSLTCAAASRDRPYTLVGQLLRYIFEIAPGDDDEQVNVKIAQRLGGLAGMPVPTDPQLHQILSETLGFAVSELPVEERKARRGRLVHLLRTLLAHTAQRKPLLLAIDDLHWVDEASLEILGQVTDGISRLPVQFVLLYRPEWQHTWFEKSYYRHLTLDELDEVACIELICMLLQTEHLPKGLASLLQKTGGNPFFITEMVKSLQERNILSRRVWAGQAREEWELRRPLTEHQLPGTIERVLRVRLERLTTATRQVLELAAVIGPTFTRDLLSRLMALQDEALEPHLAELEQRGFLEARWQFQDYRFCHALLLNTIYQDMLPSRRQSWHRRIAETLETTQNANYSQDDIETLAHHYYHSLLRSLPTEAVQLDDSAPPAQIIKALEYLYRCGMRAQDRFAAREAINYYQRALLLLPLAPDQQAMEISLRVGLGDVYDMAGNFDLAYASLRQAYAVLHSQPLTRADSRRAADLARHIGRLCAWQGEHEVGLRWMGQGLRELGEPADDDELATAALLYIHMGSIYYNKGEADMTLQLCRRGLQMAEASHAEVVCAEGHNLLGVVLSSSRQNEQALIHYQQSLQLWETHGNRYQMARVAGNIGVVYYDEGNLDVARQYYSQDLDYLEQIEDFDPLAYRHLNLGNIYLCSHEYQQAQSSFETALALWEQMNNQRWIALCYTNLGLLAIEQEDWGVAAQHLNASRQLLERLDIRDMLPEVYYSLADVALGQGDAPAALELAQQALTLASALEMPFEMALARRCEGRTLVALGNRDAGRTHLEESVRMLRELKSLFELARTLVWLAKVYTSMGEVNAARTAVQEAEAIFAQMGVTFEVDPHQLPAAQRSN